ncbi:MAG TPA: YhcH/YjgK/YiaL family protein [Bacteroidales bacterium]|nr:YhcH/YjgK/YiaL family protein [Bacteroidales bacterium]
MYVIVDEYINRNEEDSAFEAHRRYIDIQHIVEGEEKIGISALENTKEITPYDNLKDIIFLTAKQNNYRIASHEKFFVFSPEDAHRPCVKTSENIRIRKVVVKIMVD